MNLFSHEKATSIWLDTTPKTKYPTLEREASTDVAVVGGGLAGLLCAFSLQQKGQKVVILESGRIGQGTSGYTTAKITSAHGLVYEYWW